MIFHQAIFGAYFLALGALLTVLDVWWVQQHWIHLTGCERKEKFQIYGGKPLFLLFQKMKRITPITDWLAFLTKTIDYPLQSWPDV